MCSGCTVVVLTYHLIVCYQVHGFINERFISKSDSTVDLWREYKAPARFE